jgi:hypothetical protein
MSMKSVVTSAVTSAVLVAIAGSAPAFAHEGKRHPGEHAREAPAKAKPVPADHGAEDDHEHPSPHGGIVATVDRETHVEVKLGEKSVDVWFYDAQMKPVALPTDAKATVVVGKDVKKLELAAAKKPDGTPDDHLAAEIVLPAEQKVAVVIQATVMGKARTARIERKAAPAAASAPVSAPANATPAPSAPTTSPKGTP